MSRVDVAPDSNVAVNVAASTTEEEDVVQHDPVEGASTPTVSREAIAARAYELFLARGGTHEDDWDDWFRAEAELLGEAPRSD